MPTARASRSRFRASACRMATGASSAWESESRVTGAGGKARMRGIETAMRALGASGARRWRLINDTVGSMLGGMASCDRSRYADFIGFILGTGTNACCHVKACDVTKSPETGGDGRRNARQSRIRLLRRALRGTAVIAWTRPPGCPATTRRKNDLRGILPSAAARNAAPCGKGRISLGEERGRISPRSPLRAQWWTLFVLTPWAATPLPKRSKRRRDSRRFASEINTMLLERAARSSPQRACAPFCASAASARGRSPASARTGRCSSSTRCCVPGWKALIAEYTKRHGLGAEFLFLKRCHAPRLRLGSARINEKGSPFVKGLSSDSEG